MVELDLNEKVRISYDMTNEEYHAHPGISASGLKLMLKSYKLYKLRQQMKRVESPALTMGTLLHERLLENKYRIPMLTDANIEKLDVMTHNGRLMFDYILKHTVNEVSVIIEDEAYGITRKVRVDAYDKANGIIYDLKTTRYNDPRKFEADAYRLGYHIQAAWYIDTMRLAGFEVKAFGFLVVPSESPNEPFAYQVTPDLIEDGRAVYAELIDGYLEFEKSESDAVTFLTMDLPMWRREQLGMI